MAQSQFGGIAVDKPVDTTESAQPKSQFGGISATKSIVPRDKRPAFTEQVAGLGMGAAKGILSAPGEIEEFLTTPARGPKLLGPGTVFPTAPETGKALESIYKPAPGTEVMQKVGEFGGPLVTSTPYLLRRGVRAVLGKPTQTTETVAREAEKLGFKLTPQQVRAKEPLAGRGPFFAEEKNQTLANQLASKGTGKQVNEISEEFIGERLSTLGKEFEKVYKGKQFNVDPAVAPSLQNLIAQETQLGFAGVSPVKAAAQSILDNIPTGKINGDDLQRLRNALTERARSTANRGNAHEIYDLVDILDKSVETLNKGMAAKLKEIRPQYRNTIILEDLTRQQGIQGGNISLEKLGNMLIGKRDALRRSEMDIDELGRIGREVGLRAMWQKQEGAPTGLGAGTKRVLTAPARTATGRAIQSYYARPPGITTRTTEALGVVPAIGEVARGVNKATEEK